MPLTSFTVGGAEVNPLLSSFEIRETVGGVSTLTCDVQSIGSPVMRFTPHQPVVVQEDGVTIYAGAVTQSRERGLGGPNLYDPSGAPQIVTTITAEDYVRLGERVYVSDTVAEGTTMAAFLATLVTHLSSIGVTLHPSQVTGPTLPEMTFDLVRASDVLQAVADATGFLWRIDYDKQLRMWEPGDLAAPFDIDEYDDPPRWTGDVEVEEILGDEYANRVTVVSEPISQEGRIERFTGDGTTDTFTLTYTLTRHYGYVTTDAAINLYETLTTPEFGGATWVYDPVTNSITRLIGPPDNGAQIEMRIDGTFQAFAMAEDAPDIAVKGLYEHVERRTDITDHAAAQALADAILEARLQAGEQIVAFETRFTAPTLRAGQQLTLTATARDLSGPYVIRDMRVRAEVPLTSDFAAAGLGLIRSMSAKRSQVLTGKWQHTYRDWLRFGTGGSAPVLGEGGAGSAGPGAPLQSVQFNRNGGFGGDPAFIYYDEQNSVVCGGGGSSITAAAFESCQVFGYNNHIADPA